MTNDNKLDSSFDLLDLKLQVSEVLALIANLRPDPAAELISREKVALMAAIAGDADLIRLATHANENTLFWRIDGEIIKQVVSVSELRIA